MPFTFIIILARSRTLRFKHERRRVRLGLVGRHARATKPPYALADTAISHTSRSAIRASHLSSITDTSRKSLRTCEVLSQRSNTTYPDIDTLNSQTLGTVPARSNTIRPVASHVDAEGRGCSYANSTRTQSTRLFLFHSTPQLSQIG